MTDEHPARPRNGGSGQAVSILDMVLDHDAQIDDLMTWRSELRGALSLVKATLGVSLLSAVASVVAIIALLSGQAK